MALPPGLPAPAVSRETAVQLFGDRLALAEQFAGLVATDGLTRGLIGPREVDRLWDRHLLNCAAVAPALPLGATAADIGSGAGLPGVVLAIARPDLSMRLVEPLLRRATFLTEVVTALGLARVEVVRARAEDLHGLWTVDVVTARAVAPLDRLLGWCLPLVRPSGVLLALKGERAGEELAAVQPRLSRWGASTAAVEVWGEGLLNPPTRVVRVARAPANG